MSCFGSEHKSSEQDILAVSSEDRAAGGREVPIVVLLLLQRLSTYIFYNEDHLSSHLYFYWRTEEKSPVDPKAPAATHDKRALSTTRNSQLFSFPPTEVIISSFSFFLRK